jgi:hypothetical protein
MGGNWSLLLCMYSKEKGMKKKWAIIVVTELN